MKLHPLFVSGMLMLSLAAGAAFGADKAQKQAEVRKATQASLERFYKANPRLKGEVERSPGYAVFTTFGVSLIIGGAGGTGMAHDRKTGARTYMNMAQASVGVQIGAAESDTAGSSVAASPPRLPRAARRLACRRERART